MKDSRQEERQKERDREWVTKVVLENGR